jgi:ribosomal protein S18 acetylase RimI-like enzyme
LPGNAAAEIRYRLAADAWLAGHIGKPVWRVDQDPEGEPLGGLRARRHAFAYAKIDAAEVRLVGNLVANGFRPVDVAVTLEGRAPRESSGTGVRFARPSDRDAVAAIASSTFRFSRFHLDPLVPPAVARAIKAEWATNYFTGRRGDGMVVAEVDGVVVGFLQLLWTGGDVLVIDLVGVGAAHQRKGIARRMIHFAAAHGTGDARKPERLRVGTQVANTQSVRLYESLGFRLIGAEYVLHYHAP